VKIKRVWFKEGVAVVIKGAEETRTVMNEADGYSLAWNEKLRGVDMTGPVNDFVPIENVKAIRWAEKKP
jgi:hypothetical protein